MDSRIDTAVIMAAGMGVRLGSLGERIPKGFLQLGERPIVEESVLRLRAAGIARVIIVTGHLAHNYRHLQAHYTDTIELVHNDAFANSGSMYSLYCARHLMVGDFLLLESDIVYEPRALEALLEASESDIVLCSGPTRSDDEVYVATEGALLREMSKDRTELSHPVYGELVGICRISASLYKVMQAEAEQAFHESLHMAYETDCLVAAARKHPVSCLRIDDLLWCEVDHEDHLRRAREQIYPRLAGRAIGRAT